MVGWRGCDAAGPPRLTILHLTLVTETYAPEINGVAMTLGRLVGHLAEECGYRVTVVRPRQPSDRGRPARWTEGAVTQHLVPGLPIPGYPLLRFGLPAGGRLTRVCREGREGRPDVVHVATEGPLGYSALRAARRLGLPVTSSFHTNFHHYTRNYRFGWLFALTAKWLRYFHNRTRRTFAPTRELCDELAAEGYFNLRVLSRGLDPTLFSAAKRDEALRASWGAGPEDPVVIHTGRLAREKNYELLLRAYAAMKVAQPRCRFVIVGDGPLRASLQAQLPEARFTGFVDRETLARHYASADVYLHASVTETYGNVAAEALASELAFAGFDYAAARELVTDGESGLLVPLGREADFIAAGVSLVNEPWLRARLRPRAPAVVRARTWTAVAARFDADLREAITDPGVGPDLGPAPAAAPLSAP
jgi:glycosyltransferase involved in cell wall biosynthesis